MTSEYRGMRGFKPFSPLTYDAVGYLIMNRLHQFILMHSLRDEYRASRICVCNFPSKIS